MEGTTGKDMKIIIKKYRAFFVAIMIFSSLITGAQDIYTYRSRIYDSYARGEMSGWRVTIEEMEKVYDRSGSMELLHELLLSQYGFIGYCLKEDMKKEASYHLARARANLETLKANKPGSAELIALEGAFFGYEMGIHKLKAMVLGPKAKEKIDGAVEKDPNSVRTLLEKANQLNFSPKIVGGDTEEAIEYYKKAIRLIEADAENLRKNWIYVNTVVVLAKAYEKLGNNSHACALYEKLIDYDINIKWVKDDLYKGCKNKSQSLQ
ncbi:MAG TPA: tetratricopeptide repeat protein [Bacteroidetes bacterium]|nr:tetratricopeptide repeat protein [Bacteroidota bacterium]